MSILQSMIDGFSGKTAKYNELISSNIIFFTNKTESYKQKLSIYYDWSMSVVASSAYISDFLLFRTEEGQNSTNWFNLIRSKLNIFDQPTFCRIFSLLSAYHLFLFEKNYNMSKDFGISEDEFEKEISDIFCWNELILNKFEDLKGKDAKFLYKNSSNLSFSFYKSILEILGIPYDSNAPLIGTIFEIFVKVHTSTVRDNEKLKKYIKE